MLKNANEVGDEAGNYGRRGIRAFAELGWVPHDEVDHAAARTQDFAYNDFCVAQVAQYLGRQEDYKTYRERAFYYKNTFNGETDFMQGRLRDGSWETPFDEFRWGGAYRRFSLAVHLGCPKRCSRPHRALWGNRKDSGKVGPHARVAAAL